jgi:molybdenum cofactor cytidylyltransferase
MTGAVVLAAGASVRIGLPKQLLAYRGRTLLRIAVESAVGAGCSPVVVVLGARADRIRPELLDMPDVRVVTNEAWSDGMASSIRTGVTTAREVEPGLRALLIVACDQPLLEPGILKKLMKAHQPPKQTLVACEYGDTVGIPALFDRERLDELLELDGDRGARAVLERHADRLARIPWPAGEQDVDTPEDWTRLTGGPPPIDPAPADPAKDV